MQEHLDRRHPGDMERYYPATYYSYAARRYNRIAGWMKGRRDRYYLGRTSVIGYLLSHVSPASSYIEWLKNLALPFGSAILDVGSGQER